MTPHGNIAVLVGLLVGTAAAAMAEVPPINTPAARQEAKHLDEMPAVVPKGRSGRIDPSGRKQKGRASYYSQHFTQRKMADGQRIGPHSNIAASKSLPLGTMAKVTNLTNGKSATIKVEDRGPYVGGRIVDVSPAVADQLDLKKDGVAPVEVKPITVPQLGGAVKLGAGAAEVSPGEVARAIDATQEFTGTKETETPKR